MGFTVGGFELGLLARGEAVVAGPQPLWGVENVDEEVARLVGLGGEVLEPVSHVGEGIRVAAIRDPSGNRFELIETPNFRRETIL